MLKSSKRLAQASLLDILEISVLGNWESSGSASGPVDQEEEKTTTKGDFARCVGIRGGKVAAVVYVVVIDKNIAKQHTSGYL